ncbi:ArnT family glycosyltransferase [Planktothrix mougeotii]|uniref:Glycosyltransferase family 39 protein n=1 Tax=Planktothrix mougeotii LEGE 06226 TaxID=1828728 RepID=A0ABR9UFR4_9CYAN|nr:glycosyltransferase family 39 protein [Planktothrix mougeotii]MBE9145305.1 glycosyltransferase family 39 protein [Planktothrix mougeotii LEGE 06226]
MKLSSDREIKTLFSNQIKTHVLPFLLAILGLGLISGLAFFQNLGNLGLLDETEPLFAEAARQMLVTGDWITPYFNEETRFDKPPLIYWLMAIAYQIVGVNEWGVRLPSAVSAFILIGLGFYTLSYYVQKTQFYTVKKQEIQGLISPSYKPRFRTVLLHPLPWMGAILMAFNPEIVAWARIGVSDMLLTGCMGSALLAFFLGYATDEAKISESEFKEYPNVGFKNLTLPQNRVNYWYLAFYILIALAVLTKGPVGIVLPILIIGSFLIYIGKGYQVLQEMRLWQGSLIFFVMTLPWYILVTLINGQSYINSFFGYHNFERFTSVVNRHAAPWYFYFIVVLIGFAPFSVYLPIAIASTKFWKRRCWKRQARIQQLPLFAVFWFAGIFIFFTVAVTKLPSYILPLIPASALLISLFWHNLIKNNHLVNPNVSLASAIPKAFSISIIFNILLVFSASIVSYFSKNLLGYDADMPNFRTDLQTSGLLNRSALIWGITTIGIIISGWKRRISGIFIVNILGFIVFFIWAATPTYSLLDHHRQEPLRHLAQTVVQERKLGEELMMVGFKKPSLVFYTQHPVQYASELTDAINYINSPEVQNSSPKTILILGHPRELANIRLKPNQYKIIDQAGSYQLIRANIVIGNRELGITN